jgi:uncharacterized phage protein (TIGR01671 family)
MREFLFRVFDKQKNIMIYDYDQSIGKIYNLQIGSSLREWLFYIGLRDETLMQFTGLHDKNGKKIWEGDIVESGFLKWIIRFEKGCFVFAHSQTAEDYSYLYRGYKEFKVIGNIYENAR